MIRATFFQRLGWLAMVAGILASGRLLHAEQEPGSAPLRPADAPSPPGRPHRSPHWLGLGCVAVDAERRAEIKLESDHGLEVGDVVPEGPADEADIEPGDVLLSADGKPLAQVEDLIAIVAEAGQKPIKLEIWNEGKVREIQVTPTERPRRERGERFAPRPDGPGHPPFPGLPGFSLEQFRRFMPGGEDAPAFMWLGPGVMVGEPFPDDLDLKIEKHGRSPAKIEVRRGDQTWTATEDNLSELPDEVRPHVERMFGRMPFMHGRWGEGAERMRRDIERHAHEGAERARHEAHRAREQGERLAREGTDRARETAERVRERVEHELRDRLPRLAPGGPMPPPGSPPGAPPGPDGGPAPPPPPGLREMIEEQIRHHVERPLGDLQRQLDELRRTLDSQAVAERLRKEIEGPLKELESLRGELGKQAGEKAGELDAKIKERGEQLEQLIERSGKRLEELLKRLPGSPAPDRPRPNPPAEKAEEETNI